MITTYDFIDSNKRKTILLVLLFPISLTVLIFISLYIYSYIDLSFFSQIKTNTFIYVFQAYWYYLVISVILSGAWIFFSFYHCSDIIIKYTGAIVPKENEYKDTKRIIENISITAGINPPKLYILERENSLNAFTVGTNSQNSSIVLTFGLISKLEKSELETVIAHEIAHIVHQDTKLMMAIILMIGFFTFLGSVLIGIKGGSKKFKGNGIIMLIGFVIYIYGNFVAPLIRLAVLRTREFQADAKAALLTRNPQSLISALQKINRHPIIDSFNRNEILAPMCIVSPLRIPISLFDTLSRLSDTHPPIKERIEALEIMDGKGNIKI